MLRFILSIIITSFLSLCAHAQDHQVFHLGHSLVSPTLPAMIQSIADDETEVNHTYNYGIINGAPLRWHWDHSDECQGYQASLVDSKVELLSGDYDVFVMTEGVPWDPVLVDFHMYADSFHSIALQGNSDIQTYLYESFNCINTGTPTGCMYDDGDTITWVNRIRKDLSTWESVAEGLNQKHPNAAPVLIIPVGQAFANLKESVERSELPGVNDFFGTFFSDDIHPSEWGHYFSALVHYATIYQRSPIGLTNQTTGEWGGSFDAPNPNLAEILQEIAWETVCNYPGTGVDCLTNDENVNDISLSLFPNPSSDFIQLESKELIREVSIYSMDGKLQMQVSLNQNTIKLALKDLKPGLYNMGIKTSMTFQNRLLQKL